MSQYKVSVVVPTFNTGDFLVETFESFRCQTIGFENIEVIFVDDASTDAYTLDLFLVFLVLGVMLVWIWLRVSVLFLQIMMIPMKKMPLK